MKSRDIKFFVIIKQKSERLKNKNFIIINKLPLYKYLLYELKGEKVYIDTDSLKIINEQKKDKILSQFIIYKRNSKFVKLENSKKFKISPVYLLIANFLEKFCNNNDIIVCSHVTSPFIKKKTIYDAIKYLDKGYESVSAATYHNEFALIKKKNKYTTVNFDLNKVNKTQDLEPIILLNGAFFIFRKKTFMKYKSRYGKKHFFYKLNYPESIDINYNEDLKIAKFYAEK